MGVTFFFGGGDHRLEAFAPCSLSLLSQIPQKNLQIRVSSEGFLHELLRFNRLLGDICVYIYI